MQEFIQEIKSKNQEIEDLRKELIERSGVIFNEACKVLFENNPTLESFGWVQYTPYFNDGDTCEFGVHTDKSSLLINGESIYDVNWYNKKKILKSGTWNRDLRIYEGRVDTDNPDYNEDLCKATNEVSDFLNVFNEDFFKAQFGDHSKINVTRNGYKVNSYEHD